MQNNTLEKDDEIFTIEINDISSIVIENSSKRKNSLFKNVYEDVFDTLGKEISNIENPHSIDECPNNIYAFIGERGTGKTSCMKSVAKMLSEGKEKLFEERKFEVIESTDPSFFDENKNILEIFLGRLFSKFEKELKSNGVHKTDEKNKVLQNFEEVKNSLACMDKKGVCEDSSVDQLIDLSASVELQKNIHDLIGNYLEYVEKDFLVIPIDDIDLHTAHAYEMAEQLRKYLIQPKTIILMALKIEQMESVIEQHYLSLYKDMLNRGMLQNSDISAMAIRYLIKLIPQSHRFPLKSVEEILNEPVKITINGKEEKFAGNIFKRIITELIYKKTKFLFYNITNEPSLIIPRNLRECCFLLAFLMHMEKSEKDASLRKYNQKKFINYFLSTWSRPLSTERQIILKKIHSCINTEHINTAIIKAIQEQINIISDSKNTPLNISDIINANNLPYNISTGDVITLFHYYESRIFNEADFTFLFALKTLYSIHLYELYSIKTSYISKENNETDHFNQSNKYENFPKFDKLIGGAFFSEADTELRNHFRKNLLNENQQETIRVISLNDIKNELRKAINPSTNKIKNIKIFNTIEFFALTVSRAYLSAKDGTADNSFREEDSRQPFPEFSPNQFFVWFDIFSIFYNIIHIKESYNRISENLYNIALENEDSLLNQIEKICHKEKASTNNKNQALLSCCCIRNIEILEKIRFNFLSTPNGDKPLETLLNILNSCNSFEASTYTLESDSYHKIKFKFTSVLSNHLSSIKNNHGDSFDTIYNRASYNTQQYIAEIDNLIKKFKKTYSSKASISVKQNNIRNMLNNIYSRLEKFVWKDFYITVFNDSIKNIGTNPTNYNFVEFNNACDKFINFFKALPVIV